MLRKQSTIIRIRPLSSFFCSQIGESPTIISFSFSFSSLTFELLSINLYELIKKNKFQGFSLQLVRKFAHSLLQCLDLLYRNKIIHCDMKPENVLLKQQGRSGIKVGQRTTTVQRPNDALPQQEKKTVLGKRGEKYFGNIVYLLCWKRGGA